MGLLTLLQMSSVIGYGIKKALGKPFKLPLIIILIKNNMVFLELKILLIRCLKIWSFEIKDKSKKKYTF